MSKRDRRTALMTVLGLASLMAGAMFMILAALAKQMPRIRLWAGACLLVGLASLIQGLDLIGDPRLASLSLNIPICIGQALILAGIMQFCGMASACRALLSIAVIGVALAVVFTYPLPDDVLRIAGAACGGMSTSFSGASPKPMPALPFC